LLSIERLDTYTAYEHQVANVAEGIFLQFEQSNNHAPATTLVNGFQFENTPSNWSNHVDLQIKIVAKGFYVIITALS